MPSQVFMMDLRASAKETNFKKFQRLLDALDVKSIIHRRKKRPLIAVKLHFGEKGNAAFIRPLYVRQVVDKIWDLGGRPFLTDANTVYVGTRSESVSHLTTAIENGFAYAVVRAPLVIADGLTGKAEVEVKINEEQFKTVFLAEAIVEAEALVTLTHFKLHELSGFGGRPEKPGDGLRLPQRQALPALQHRPQGNRQRSAPAAATASSTAPRRPSASTPRRKRRSLTRKNAWAAPSASWCAPTATSRSSGTNPSRCFSRR